MSRKPIPLHQGRPPKRCPICGQASYSSQGIHPQCSARQSDSQRVSQCKAAAAAEATSQAAVALKTDMNPWQTVCPKCRVVVHIRRKVCECGHHLLEKRN
jgi:hypothetical protein